MTAAAKRRHDHGAEAVDQPLHHQDAEIHDGLLHAGHHRKVQDGGKVLFVPPAVLFFRAELRELFQCVQSDADAGYELREGGGGRGPRTPQCHTSTHTRSRITLSTADTAKNSSGTTELPMARRRFAK